MSKHRMTTRICVLIVALTVLFASLYSLGESIGISDVSTEMPYATRLFDETRVHTLDILVNESDWQTMLDNATDKAYIQADVVLDGEAVGGVGIRTKGNSTLSTMARSESDRYSFKLEFDHYSAGKTYYGLDKLVLNNIAQDNTYLKDFLSYQLMVRFGAPAPLTSYIWITVNGEDFGLYLAVEAVEESFAQRNYGRDYGQIYKPETGGMDMGGGRGQDNQAQQMPQMPEFSEEQLAQLRQAMEAGDGGMPQMDGGMRGGGFGGGGFGGFGGQTDTALVYTDDDPDSYANILGSAKFALTNEDEQALITALRQLATGEDLQEVIDVESVLRYFVVHNFVLNFDSYTGSMLHNYYLHEQDGVLSMIAWDYNLAFGAFSMGGGRGGMGGGSAADEATTLVNYPIDTPTSGAELSDRPMLGQLLREDTYLDLYHELFDAFISEVFESGEFAALIDSTIALITPYVERDPTAFCTPEEFAEGSQNLREFCLLRAESIRGQLDGTIPSTDEGQAADGSALVDASGIDMSVMGSMQDSFGGGGGGMGRDRGRGQGAQPAAEGGANAPAQQQAAEAPVQQAALSLPVAAAEEAAEEGSADMQAGQATGQMGQPPEGFTPENPAQSTGTAETAQTDGAQAPQGAEDAQNAMPQWPDQFPGAADENAMRGGEAIAERPNGNTTTAQSGASRNWIYLGVSALLLLLGVVIAKAY